MDLPRGYLSPSQIALVLQNPKQYVKQYIHGEAGWTSEQQKFGSMIHNILEENAELLTEEFAAEIRNIVIEGVDLEVAYNKDLFPNGILGLNADYVNQYVQYVADRRLEELGLPKHYGATNPAKWMSTATDVYELVNFFEAQNTSYEVDSHAHAKKKAEPAAMVGGE